MQVQGAGSGCRVQGTGYRVQGAGTCGGSEPHVRIRRGLDRMQKVLPRVVQAHDDGGGG